MPSPLPTELHAQAVALAARGVGGASIARMIGRPMEQVKQAIGWKPGRRKGTS